MKTKQHFRIWSDLKVIVALTIIAIAVIAFSSCNDDDIPDNTISGINAPPPPPPPPPFDDAVAIVEEDVVEPFEIVEEMPLFPGGDMELIKYIAEATHYPVVAKENNIQGRVIVRFCITDQGGINQVSVIKGVDPVLDSEAIRVVKTLPDFTPGKQGGKPVPVWYMVPITFRLK